VNFYGTLNLHTGEEIAMQSDKMNAEAAAEHLQQILDVVPGERPILLLWDRAPWHSGEPIRELLAANPRLEVLRLPTAAPDFNPQEHVWKATRRAVSHNHLHPRFPGLADQFEKHLKTNTFESSFLDRYGYNDIYPMFK
jgi:transposase